MNILYYPPDMIEKAIENIRDQDEKPLPYTISDQEYGRRQLEFQSRFRHLLDGAEMHHGSSTQNFVLLTVSLSTMPGKPIEVYIDSTSSIKLLMREIASKFQMKMKFLNGINSLRVKNLRKITSVDESSESSPSQGDEDGVPIPSEGKVLDFLKTDDRIICDFESRELWIKSVIKFDSETRSCSVEVDTKVNRFLSISDFKKMMQKLCFCIWSNLGVDENDNNEYVLKRFEFELDESAIGNISFECESEDSMDSLDFDKSRTRGISMAPKLPRLIVENKKESLEAITSVNSSQENSDMNQTAPNLNKQFSK